MYKKIIPLFFIVISTIALISGCGGQDKKLFTVPGFQEVILRAMRGDAHANDTLSQLFDLSIPVNPRYNSFTIDSFSVKPGKRVYTVLLEYANPFYNRFAIYDSSLNLLLLDKSLNGNLLQTKFEQTKVPFIGITESFRSKDNIKLERLSLYGVKRDSAVLSLRIFLKYDDSTSVLRQELDHATGDIITMKISAEPSKLLSQQITRYALDTVNMRFRGDIELFTDAVNNMILKYKKKFSDDQIFDKKSALVSIGNLAPPDSDKNYSNAKDRKAGFSLTLPPSGWTTKKDINISSQLRKSMRGTLYSNDAEGAKIAVIEIPTSEMAEAYLFYNLDLSATKNYSVRYTEKIPFKRSYLRFFEYTCANKKYLLIFEAPQASYQTYGKEYEQIINSFNIDC